jgi:hypothetical protein
MPWIVCCREQTFQNVKKRSAGLVKRKTRSETLLSEVLPRQQGNTNNSSECNTTGQVQHFLSCLRIGRDAAGGEETLCSEWSDDAEEATPEGCQSGTGATNGCREDLGSPSVKHGVEH